MASAGKKAIVGGKLELGSGCEGAQAASYLHLPSSPSRQILACCAVGLVAASGSLLLLLGVYLWSSCTAQLLGAADEGRDATLTKKWEGFHGQRHGAFLACELLLLNIKDLKHG